MFVSQNYTQIQNTETGEWIQVEPGIPFDGSVFKSKKEDKEDNSKDTEISTPVQEELDYRKTQTVTVIGRFENGDYEVCNNNDLSDTWRVPKDTFESTYEVVEPTIDAPDAEGSDEDESTGADDVSGDEVGTTDEVQDETIEEAEANSKETGVSEESDPSNTVELSLEDFKGKTIDEIKDIYTVDQMRVLAKEVGIKQYSQMRETKLATRLLEAAEKAE